MADDDRTRRRLGDETKSRIADLASGWSVESPSSESAPAPDEAASPPRKKQRTIPPPAPGSPERKAFEEAFEQQIVATTADRDDATDVLPPKRPTGVQPIVATTPTTAAPKPIVATAPTRDDATDVLGDGDQGNRRPVPHAIVATTPARDDATDELVEARPISAAPAARSAGDPRATHASAPPPPPQRARNATGQGPTAASETPSAGARPQTSTGPQSIVSGRAKGSTGQQPVVAAEPPAASARPQTNTGPHSVIGGRARTGTGQLSIIPDIPMRAKSSTGQQSVAPRTRSATGGHALIPTRSQSSSGPNSINPARSTAQDRIVDDRERERVLSATGPHSILTARTKGTTGEQPIVARTTAPSGPHGVVAAPADPSGTQPHSGVPPRRAGASVPPPVPLATPRTKSASVPPPPPGSPERAAAERGSAYSTQPFGSADRTKPPTAPPPAGERSSAFSTQPLGSADRKKSASAPPSPSDRSKPASVPPPANDRGGVFSTQPAPPHPPPSDRSKPASVPPPANDRGRVFSTQPTPPHPPPSDRGKPASVPPPANDRGGVFSTQPVGSADRQPAFAPPSIDRSKPTSASPPTAQGATAPSPFETVRPKPASLSPATADRSKPISMPPIVFPTSESWSTTATEPDHENDTADDDEPAVVPAVPAVSSGPRYPRATNGGPATPFSTEGRTFSVESRTPAVIVDASLASEPATIAPSQQLVPTGEFDSGDRTIRDQTNPRDAAEALLAIPHTETPVEELLEDDDDEAGRRPMHAAPDPATEKFERGDPTQNAPPDGTQVQHVRTKHPTGGTLRTSAALRRKRGVWGDVRYVATAVFGVRRSRRELVELEHRQGLRETSRRRHLITLGRTAAVMDNFDHPSLGKSREQLASVEDERSKHAGAVAASDAELERVRRDRDNSAKQCAIAKSETDAELAELATKLEPVEKEALASRKRASELRDELRRIEKQIADAEASLVSARSERVDKAAVQADIATYRANKVAVLRDEPVIAAELDALDPQIAAIEATRTGLEKKKAELDKAEQEDQRRTVELLEAIGAKRKVVERAAADAETARDNALFELGERLYVDRPSILTAQLSPIDRIDLELGEGERRSMELKEILSNIDRWKFARGLAMIILAVGIAASLAMLIASVVL